MLDDVQGLVCPPLPPPAAKQRAAGGRGRGFEGETTTGLGDVLAPRPGNISASIVLVEAMSAGVSGPALTVVSVKYGIRFTALGDVVDCPGTTTPPPPPPPARGDDEAPPGCFRGCEPCKTRAALLDDSAVGGLDAAGPVPSFASKTSLGGSDGSCSGGYSLEQSGGEGWGSSGA